MNILTDQQKIDIVNKYQYGFGSVALAKEFGVSSKAILSILKSRGIERRKTGNHNKVLSPEDVEKLKDCAKNSFGLCDLIRNFCGKNKYSGSQVKRIKNFINLYNIDTTHWQPIHLRNSLGTIRHLKKNKQNPLDILKDKNIKHNKVKKAFSEIMAPKQCSVCYSSNYWNGKILTLQLDHIDGDNKNNDIKNLRWLCPNCHSQTNTFCSGQKGSKKYPTKEELLEMHKTKSISQMSKELDVSYHYLCKKMERVDLHNDIYTQIKENQFLKTNCIEYEI